MREAAAQLVRDGNLDLATNWSLLSDWPSDFGMEAVAAAWDMEENSTAIQDDLEELRKRGLILFHSKLPATNSMK